MLPNTPESKQMLQIAGRYSALGLEMAAAFVLPVLAGGWLDDRYDTEPYALLFGIVVGVGAASNAVYRVVRSYKRSIASRPPDPDT